MSGHVQEETLWKIQAVLNVLAPQDGHWDGPWDRPSDPAPAVPPWMVWCATMVQRLCVQRLNAKIVIGLGVIHNLRRLGFSRWVITHEPARGKYTH